MYVMHDIAVAVKCEESVAMFTMPVYACGYDEIYINFLKFSDVCEILTKQDLFLL